MTAIRVGDIAGVIESFAPKRLQESYDNAGLQVGDPDMQVSAVLLCLDVTPEILEEAKRRQCNLIISHHPLLFSGLKQITGRTPVERIVIDAITNHIAIYSAHTNLDSAIEGVSYEIAHALDMRGLSVLEPKSDTPEYGLGVIGDIKPTPTLEFLRKVKELFNVSPLRYSAMSPQIVIRKVAVCGGAGASLIRNAITSGADVLLTGDLKYHDYTSYGYDILLADIGHYESELGSRKIFSRIIREAFPECVTYFAETESNPIAYM
ncbi:MAG: Nif3-like dinuclear metal center hexameric protein [Muribaculaceae bacterium]|nr:Nif3-like dinuclear metal center hexameric protein [Muribaculaceae bacterium]